MIRRVAIGVTMLILLSTASVSAATKTVQVFNSAYNPTPIKVKLGTNVNWHNGETARPHTSTADLFGLWNKSLSPGVTSGTVAFKQSGSFAYHCNIHSFMHGVVNVRMKATPTTGTLSTTYVIRFATVNAPVGFTYDIQRRKHGTTFAPPISNTGQTMNFTAPSKGKWEFHSRLRRTSDNVATGYSPILTVTVN